MKKFEAKAQDEELLALRESGNGTLHSVVTSNGGDYKPQTPAWFDAGRYMSYKLAQLGDGWDAQSMLAAFNGTGYSGPEGYYRHFLDWGNRENVSPNKYFDSEYYFQSKLDQLHRDEPDRNWTLESTKQAFEEANLSAWDHYMLYGISEGIDPCGSFSTSEYLEAKLEALHRDEPDKNWTMDSMLEAFRQAELNPVQHYLLYGMNENLDFNPEADSTSHEVIFYDAAIPGIDGGPGFDILIGDGAPDALLAGGSATQIVENMEAAIEGTEAGGLAGALIAALDSDNGAVLAANTLSAQGWLFAGVENGSDATNYARYTHAGDDAALLIATERLSGSTLGTFDDDALSGGEDDDTLDGGDGNDWLDGGAGNDLLYGDAGNDTLYGQDGDDTLDGGDSSDLLEGGAGNDVLCGGAGNDMLYGQDGDDTLEGDSGNDVLEGGTGDDSLNGANGDDVLKGGDGNDYLNGGSGSDSLEGDSGNDTLYGGDNDDLLRGDGGNDMLYGQESNDTLDGGDGDDYLNGGTDNDTLHGQDGDDTLDGDSGNDTLDGGNGNDRLLGNADDDMLSGDAGDDALFGGDGNDTLEGGDGNDTLEGGTGDDTLDGGDGNDTLEGGDGNDTLEGGTGDDTLEGGTGKDTFIINKGDGHDMIRDFAEEDTLLLGSGIAASDLSAALDGTDLVLAFGDGTEQDIRLKDWLISDVCPNLAVLSDGTTVNLAKLLADHNNGQYLEGDWGRNYLYADSGNDVLKGGAGNDELGGAPGNNVLLGDAGDDDLFDEYNGNDENKNADTLAGGSGNDALDGKSGDDMLYGGSGNDWLNGGKDNDMLFGGPGDDILLGGLGIDTLDGGDGDDILGGIVGGFGIDTLDGGDGKWGRIGDMMDGGAGNDILLGGVGNRMDGGAGNDMLFGGVNSDSLYGADGNDFLYCAFVGKDNVADGGPGIDFLGGASNAINAFLKGVSGTEVKNMEAAIESPGLHFSLAVLAAELLHRIGDATCITADVLASAGWTLDENFSEEGYVQYTLGDAVLVIAEEYYA